MFRFLLVAVAASAIVVLGFVIDAQSRAPAVHDTPAALPFAIYAPGRVEGATPEVELRPQLTGRVVQVAVREGDTVEQGQLLLQLDDAQYRHAAALAAADIELAEAQLERLLNGAHHEERSEAAALYRAKAAELERAQLAWKRISELRQAHAVSQQQADNQRTLVAAVQAELAAAKARVDRIEAEARPDEIRIAKARIQAARSRFDLTRVDFERCQVRAPCKGQILRVDIEPGELTGPTAALPAIVMADTSQLRVRAFVEEMDAPRVEVGMTASLAADGLPNQQLTGRVARLSPRMTRKSLWSDRPDERYDTKTREVWIDLEQNDRLVIGLPVDVTIDTRPAPARQVPQQLGQDSTASQATTQAVASQEPLPGAVQPPLLSPTNGYAR